MKDVLRFKKLEEKQIHKVCVGNGREKKEKDGKRGREKKEKERQGENESAMKKERN